MARQNAELNAEPNANLPSLSGSAEGRDERHGPPSRTCQTAPQGRPAAPERCYKNNSCLRMIYKGWRQKPLISWLHAVIGVKMRHATSKGKGAS